MTTLEKIEAQIAKLSPKEVARLTKWLVEYDAALWDKRIEQDAKSGRLDKLAAEAKADYRAGRTRPLP
jgi:hypothetical protein